MKKLHKLQEGWIFKLVRKLDKKTCLPEQYRENERKKSSEVLSPDVTSALKFLKEQAGPSSHSSFTFAGPAIIFMKNIFHYLTLQDTSSKKYRIFSSILLMAVIMTAPTMTV